MNMRSYFLLRGVALTAAVALLAAACDRQVAVPPSEPAPPPRSVGTQIDDTVITTKVKAALLGNAEVKGFDIKVETRKGMVQLSGFVSSGAAMSQAVRVAGGITGVSSVRNDMRIK